MSSDPRRCRHRVLLGIGATLAIVAWAVAPAAVASGGDVGPPPWLGDVPGLGDKAPDTTPSDPPIDMDGCSITNPMFNDDPDHVKQFVHGPYELGTNAYFGPTAATIMAAVLACQHVRIAGRPPQSDAPRTVLSVVAIQIQTDANSADPIDAGWERYNQTTLNFLPFSSWYLVAGQTDNHALGHALRRHGLAVATVPDVRYTNDFADGGTSDSLSIPSMGYELTTSTKLADPFVHNHDWRFRGDDPTTSGFFLHLHAMADSSCGYHASPIEQVAQPPCETTVHASQPVICDLLGGTTRTTPYAFNHPKSSNTGYITFPDQ